MPPDPWVVRGCRLADSSPVIRGLVSGKQAGRMGSPDSCSPKEADSCTVAARMIPILVGRSQWVGSSQGVHCPPHSVGPPWAGASLIQSHSPRQAVLS